MLSGLVETRLSLSTTTSLGLIEAQSKPTMRPGSGEEPYDCHIFKMFGPLQCLEEERFRLQICGELFLLSVVVLV